MKPLSRRQIQVLVQVARKAFAHVAAEARVHGEEFDSSAAAFDTFRHSHVMAACGRPGLRSAGNDDYRSIMARFESVLGNDGKAMEDLLLAQNEKRRQAENVLVREMERAGLGPAYVQTICRSQFKVAVEDASAEQLLKLTFTVRNRAAAKRRAQPQTTTA